MTWIAPKAKNRMHKNLDDAYWEVLTHSLAWKTWSGYAFEAICFKQIKQIKKALHIPEGTQIYSWRYHADEVNDGAQIDLVFDRPDGIINLCEIKYWRTPFVIDKSYAKKLQMRADIYHKVTKTTKQIFHSMITSHGLKKTMYSEELIVSSVKLGDLFKAI